MTDLSLVGTSERRSVKVSAKSYEEALVQFLDAWLCVFSAELFIGKNFHCTVFDDSDEDNIRIECEWFVAAWTLRQHNV